MSDVMKIAAFSGNPNIESAISERIEFTGDYIEEYNLRMANGQTPPENWPCAIFRPESGLHCFNLRNDFGGTLDDSKSCGEYGLPKGVQSAVYMSLEGDEDDIRDFCQAVCDMSGMTCYLLNGSDDGYKLDATVTSMKVPMPEADFIDMLFEYLD